MPQRQFGAIIDAEGLFVVTTGATASDCSAGQAAPLGATLSGAGVNFSLYASDPVAVELCLFDHIDAPEPDAVVPLAGEGHRSGHYWHGHVQGLKAG